MNPNISIYRRLNPRLLVQVGMGLGLLHWANMSNISLTKPLSSLEEMSSSSNWVRFERESGRSPVSSGGARNLVLRICNISVNI